MKFFFTYLLFLGICPPILAQSGSVSASSTISPDGVTLPRLTTNQRNNIILPAKGLSIFNVDANQVDVYDGTQWKSTISAASGTFILNDKNIGFGTGVLNAITSGKENIAIGRNSLFSNTTGNDNTAIGKTSLYHNTTGYWSVAVGNEALLNNTTGHQNTAIGFRAMELNITGVDNVAVGYRALRANETGWYNVALGKSSLLSNITGERNVAVGYRALSALISGSNNIAIGRESALRITTGENNIFIGSEAGSHEKFTNVSNTLVIGPGYTDKPLIYGNFIQKILNIEGTLILESNPVVPVSSNSTGKKGQIAYDTNYFYLCVSDNVWKRFVLNSW